MDTERLIGLLAADGNRNPVSMQVSWIVALAVSAVLAAGSFFVLLGPRPDIMEAAQIPRFLFKFVVTLVLLITATLALSTLARPGAPLRLALSLLFCAPVLLVIAVAAEVAVVPAGEIRGRLVGTNAAICLAFIPLLGIGPLAALLITLRRGAPTRPVLSGLVAGLGAGGLAATFYASHCTDDSPLFVGVWYPLAIGILAATGGILGHWTGRW
jgi:hypothetical protein